MDAMLQSHIPFSIVLPVRNEAANIGNLIREINEVFENRLHRPAEIVVVDDASDDKSVAAIENVVKEMTSRTRSRHSSPLVEITLITQPQRCGQSQSLMKGLIAARGDLVVSMDSDGQYTPAEIPRLIEKMEDFDMLCGIRKNRSDAFLRFLSSKIGNAFRNLLAGKSVNDAGCMFRIMRKPCIAALKPFEGRLFGCEFFFHPQIIMRKDFRVGEIAVSHRPRMTGKSGDYPLWSRLLRGLAACVKIRLLLESSR
jgi:dolichol-phosphate mannosyltransferase